MTGKVVGSRMRLFFSNLLRYVTTPTSYTLILVHLVQNGFVSVLHCVLYTFHDFITEKQ